MAKLLQFREGHPKPAFSIKRAKGGQKIAQKIVLTKEAQKNSEANGIILL